MPLDYDLIKNWPFPELRHRYTEKDTILYALGIGLGHDPVDAGQLKYVYEDGLRSFPSMAAIMGYPGFWMKDPKAGIDWVKIVHGEQRMHFHAPIPPSGEVVGRSHISRIIDKGADKGALVVTERQVRDAADNRLLATVEQVTFCRGDGGVGRSDEPLDALPKVPDRAPDHICTLPTLAQAALIYRLSGDDNPLHADPAVARNAGFERPILHGLCTYGVAAHALVKSVCNYDEGALAYMHTRFSAPVYPGETLSIEIWEGDEEGKVHFQAKVTERDIIVLSNGIAGVRK